MKKLQSTLPNMLIVLTCIAIVAGGALAKVNEITEGPISENASKALTEGINHVLEAENAVIERVDSVEGAIVYKTDKGVAVQSMDPNGFGGTLKVLVGFDETGCIRGYTVLQHAETPGLGAKAEQWFQKGQKGNIIGLNPGEKALTVSKDGGQVDAITASTITSRAFLRAVNEAYKAYAGDETDVHSGASAQHHEEKVDAESGASEQHHEGEHHEGRHGKKEHVDRHGNKHSFKK